MESENTTPTAQQQTLFVEKKRKCDYCQKEYPFKTGKSKFCSDVCRARNSEKKNFVVNEAKHSENLPVVHASSFVSHNQLRPETIFMIEELKRSRDQIQKNYDDERARRKKFQDRVVELEKEALATKHAHELDKIQNAKPSGLSGLSENPMVMKLIEYVGPALGAYALKHAQGGTVDPAEQLVGLEGQLDDAGKEQLMNIAQWFTALPKGLQESVNNLMFGLNKIPQEQLGPTIIRIQNLLNHGTTAQHHNTSMYGT